MAATSIITNASPSWEVGVNDLESDNRGHAIQWDATSCSAYHDLVPIHPFLPPPLYSSFGGLLHTEQQMFFSWYYMQIFQAAAQSWYYHMRNVMTLTFLAVTNLLSHFSLEPKNLQLYIIIVLIFIVVAAAVISNYLLNSGTHNFLPFFLISSTDYCILFRPC